MNRTLMLVSLAVVALIIGFVVVRPMGRARPTTSAFQTMESVDPQLAEKAQTSCWFKVKNRSSRSEEVRQWVSVSATGATTMRLGELLIVTGAIQPPVRDDYFYGCSLLEYTAGSPVVMTATTAPAPLSADNLIPFGF